MQINSNNNDNNSYVPKYINNSAFILNKKKEKVERFLSKYGGL